MSWLWLSMKELRSHCRRYLGLTEDDLDYVLDEATEQNAKPRSLSQPLPPPPLFLGVSLSLSLPTSPHLLLSLSLSLSLLSLPL